MTDPTAFDSLVASISRQVETVWGAPVPFFVLFAGLGVIIWRVLKHHYEGRLATKDDQLALRDDRIADYKSKLEGASPDEAAARIEALESEVARLKPKEFSKEQMATLTQHLRGTPGRVDVMLDMAYGAGQKLADQLTQAFEAGGWNVSQGYGGGPGNLPPEGISLGLRPDNRRGPDDHALIKAFRAAGIPFAQGVCGPDGPRIALTRPMD